ncbi:unnamed protein product, partial [marine sediment metagenome]
DTESPGGLHGVGISVVNALSEWLEVEIRRDSRVFSQRFEKGIPVSDLKVIGKSVRTETKITFMPDPDIFEEINFNFDIIAHRLRELAFLNAGAKIDLKDEREPNKEVSYKYNGGNYLFPHRDDFLVYINKANAALYGSQGQQRTSILSLKLAEVDLIKEREGVYPIFLLDDVMSELDKERRHFLLELIINKKVQTFITSISLNYFNDNIKEKGKIFRVEEGKVSVL